MTFLEGKKSTLVLVGFLSFPGRTCGGQASRGEGGGEDTRRRRGPAPQGPFPGPVLRWDSEEHSGSPGRRPWQRPRGVSGYQTRRAGDALDDRSPWRRRPWVPLSPSWLQTRGHTSPPCRLFHGQSVFPSFLCDLPAPHCCKSWPLDTLLPMSLMTFPPSLCTSSDSDRAPPREAPPPGAASCLCSGVLLENVPSPCAQVPSQCQGHPTGSPQMSELSDVDSRSLCLCLCRFPSHHSWLCVAPLLDCELPRMWPRFGPNSRSFRVHH